MREVHLLIIHCSDSDHAHHDNIETITDWHLARGFTEIGYNFVILKDGTIKEGRHLDKIPSHCKGYNRNSIGICLTGKTNFSDAQRESLKELCKDLLATYHLDKKDILPHCALDKTGKTCPNFDVHGLVSTWDF